MERANEVSEDDLHAYVDGALPRERIAEIEAAIDADPKLALLVSGWIGQNEAIRDAFVVEAASKDDRAMVRARRPARSFGWLAAASVAVAFAVGSVAGFGFGRLNESTPRLAAISGIAQASRANYVVYASEVRHPVEVRADEKDHLVAWLGKRLGEQMHAPDLDALGFHLVGGRLVTYGDAPGAMLMYQDEAGARLTMLTARNPGNDQTGFRFDRTGEVDTFYWIDGAFGFAISGEVGRQRLEQVADAVYAQIGQ